MRTLVAGVTNLLVDFVVDALRAESPVDIIAVLRHGDDLAASLRKLAPQLLLLGPQTRMPRERVPPLLAAAPGLRILALSADGRRAALHWIDGLGIRHESRLRDFASADLAQAMREASRPH